MNSELINTEKMIVKAPASFLDFLTGYVSIIAFISTILLGNYLLTLVVFAVGFNAVNSIITGTKQIDIKPITSSKKLLYEVKNDKEETTYIMADSSLEANMYCELHNIKNTPSYIGKVNCFV
jgi:hypothetical protein